MQSRTVDIHINGKQFASGNAAVATTGGWNTANQKLLSQNQLGGVYLKPNDNIMVIRREHVFSHFRQFVLTSCTGPREDWRKLEKSLFQIYFSPINWSSTNAFSYLLRAMSPLSTGGASNSSRPR
jgi:hypothetical protein